MEIGWRSPLLVQFSVSQQSHNNAGIFEFTYFIHAELIDNYMMPIYHF